jgi:hypothetical protein
VGLLGSCGRKEEPKAAQTPYGSAEEVTSYLQKVKPFINQVSAFEVELHQKVGASGQATGRNLSEAMEAIKPRLQQTLREFEQIDPPALMAPFHRDMKKLMATRLEAYDTTIRGRQLEVASKDTSLYKQAEQRLVEANQISLQLNDEIRKINQLIQQAAAPKPSSP